MFKPNREFDATVVNIVDDTVDADTIDLFFDLGFGTWQTQRIRLVGPGNRGVDAWEKRGPERAQGLVAEQYVESLLMVLGSTVSVKTYRRSKNSRKSKKGKYGRYLAEIALANGSDLATLLVQGGHAEWKDY